LDAAFHPILGQNPMNFVRNVGPTPETEQKPVAKLMPGTCIKPADVLKVPIFTAKIVCLLAEKL
jgi:hypothetical protein